MKHFLNAATCVLVLTCLPFIASAARMYQWVDPESDTPQLSGTPPTWYRSTEGGPRVIVYERGQIIDDTGLAVPDVDREQLRQTAFIQAEQDREAAREKLLQAAHLKAVLGKQRAGEEEEVVEEIVVPDLPEEVVPVEQAGAPTPEQLRSLIEEWERSRGQSARQIIDGGAVPPPPPPPED